MKINILKINILKIYRRIIKASIHNRGVRLVRDDIVNLGIRSLGKSDEVWQKVFQAYFHLEGKLTLTKEEVAHLAKTIELRDTLRPPAMRGKSLWPLA